MFTDGKIPIFTHQSPYYYRDRDFLRLKENKSQEKEISVCKVINLFYKFDEQIQEHSSHQGPKSILFSFYFFVFLDDLDVSAIKPYSELRTNFVLL